MADSSADLLPDHQPKHNIPLQPPPRPLPLRSLQSSRDNASPRPSPDRPGTSAATIGTASTTLQDPLRRPHRNLSLRDRPSAATSPHRRDTLPSAQPPASRNPSLQRAGDSARTTIPALPATAGPRYPLSRGRSLRARPLSTPTTSTSTNDHSTTPASPAHNRPSSAASSTTTSATRTPSQRRPPAYRSSHGIETTYGPPPALITRSGATSEVVRRIQQQYREALNHHIPGYFGFEETRVGRARRSSISTSTLAHSLRNSSVLHRRARDARVGSWSAMSQDEGSGVDLGDSNGSYGALDNSPIERRGTPDDQTATTDSDVFLKLAESPRPQDDVTERRRSRIARATQRQSLPENVIPPAAKTPTFSRTLKASNTTESPRTDPHQLRNNRISAPLSASSAPRQTPTLQDSSARTSTFIPSSRTTQLPRRQSQSSNTAAPSPGLRSPEQYAYGRRRPSLGSGLLEPLKSYKPSKLNYTSSRDTDNAAQPDNQLDLARFQKPDGTTESVGSSHAPSTVWDELDELKSRIRKLEMTGQMPATSSQAMQGASMAKGPVSSSSNERPRTASTLPTTISSSPQAARKNSVSTPETAVGGPAAASLHPNLHSALAKCKDMLNPALYRALETTANDALNLAAMTGAPGSQGTTYSSASTASSVTVVDRNVRRKADSMCRSLTELCIALCDSKSEPLHPSSALNSPATVTAYRRGSRDESAFSPGLTPTIRDMRGASVEPEMLSRNSPSRALNRIEARRASLMTPNQQIQSSPISALSTRDPREPRSPTMFDLKRSSSTRTADSSRFVDRLAERTGTSLLRARPRKTTMEQDLSADENENERTLRAPSRALTELPLPLHQRRASMQQTHIPGPALPLPQRSHTHRISRDYNTLPLSSPRDVESRLERSKERLPVESRLGLREREVREYSPASDQTRQLLRNLRNTSGYVGAAAERSAAVPRTLRTDRDRGVRYIDGDTRTLGRSALGERGVRGVGVE